MPRTTRKPARELVPITLPRRAWEAIRSDIASWSTDRRTTEDRKVTYSEVAARMGAELAKSKGAVVTCRKPVANFYALMTLLDRHEYEDAGHLRPMLSNPAREALATLRLRLDAVMNPQTKPRASPIPEDVLAACKAEQEAIGMK